MLPYLLGIDIGTGSVKAVAIDLKGNLLDSIRQDHPATALLPDKSEQDPDMLVSVWMKTLSALIERRGSQPVCISLSSAMHGLIAVDSSNKPLSPLITWSDLRAASIAARLRTSAEGEDIYRHTGTPLHAMSPLCKLIWLREEEPELFQTANRFISIKEYIWQKLFGEFAVDHSIASATGLFDIETKDWYGPALELAGIDAGRLSKPVPTDHTRRGCRPGMAASLSIDSEVLFCIGASDGCLANLATRALDPGIVALTIGTSGAVRRASGRPLPNWQAMPFSYMLDERTFICGGPVNNGGNVVQWLLQKFCAGDTTEAGYNFLFEAAEKIPAGSEGLVFLPYLFGERAPVWDEQACGVYFGIGARHGQGHFIRAALEGICFGLRQVLELLEEEGSPVEELHVSGGFVQSAVWMQLLADITRKKLWVPPSADASATGAAYLALRALGHSIESLTAPLPGARYIQPDNGTAYERNFTLFKKLYPTLKDLMDHP
jgi:gluconokinase